MPHFGQSPGASRMISGCIGQVHCVPAGLAAAGFLCSPVRKCEGSAANLSRHFCEQKCQVLPSCSKLPLPAPKGDVHAADRILHGRGAGRVMVVVLAVFGVRILGLVMMVVPVQFGVRVHGSPLQVVLLPA